MYAMNCKTENFEALDINNFTVVRVRIWERWRKGEQTIGFSFSIITASLTFSQQRRGRGGGKRSAQRRKFPDSSQTSPQLTVEHFVDLTSSLPEGSCITEVPRSNVWYFR
jgi:hypothetical protein